MKINVSTWPCWKRRSLVVFLFIGPGWIMMIGTAFCVACRAFLGSLMRTWADTFVAVGELWEESPWWIEKNGPSEPDEHSHLFDQYFITPSVYDQESL